MSHLTHHRSFWRHYFTGMMTQLTASKHWRRVISSQSHQAHHIMLLYINTTCMYTQHKNMQTSNKSNTHTNSSIRISYYKPKSGGLNLWATQIIALQNTSTTELFWRYSLLLLTKSELRCGQRPWVTEANVNPVKTGLPFLPVWSKATTNIPVLRTRYTANMHLLLIHKLW